MMAEEGKKTRESFIATHTAAYLRNCAADPESAFSQTFDARSRVPLVRLRDSNVYEICDCSHPSCVFSLAPTYSPPSRDEQMLYAFDHSMSSSRQLSCWLIRSCFGGNVLLASCSGDSDASKLESRSRTTSLSN